MKQFKINRDIFLKIWGSLKESYFFYHFKKRPFAKFYLENVTFTLFFYHFKIKYFLHLNTTTQNQLDLTCHKAAIVSKEIKNYYLDLCLIN